MILLFTASISSIAGYQKVSEGAPLVRILSVWPRTTSSEMEAVAELEAIAQTAFRQACGEQVGVMARPARISKARKTLGKVHRTKLPDLIVRVPIFGAGPIIVHWIADEEIA